MDSNSSTSTSTQQTSPSSPSSTSTTSIPSSLATQVTRITKPSSPSCISLPPTMIDPTVTTTTNISNPPTLSTLPSSPTKHLSPFSGTDASPNLLTTPSSSSSSLLLNSDASLLPRYPYHTSSSTPSLLMSINATTESIPSTFSTLHNLLLANQFWARKMIEQKPDFFKNLSMQQSPQVLWMGCSDSRVPANQIVNLEPGEVFVHRNISNVVLHADMNCLSVLQYAVDVLKVKHVIVCGHYGCSGIVAAMLNRQLGLIDNWLRAVKDVYFRNEEKFDKLPDFKSRADLLCELNVAQSVRNVCATTIVQNAWDRNQELSIHGWCYRLEDGLIRDLGLCVSNMSQVTKIYKIVEEKSTPET